MAIITHVEFNRAKLRKLEEIFSLFCLSPHKYLKHLFVFSVCVLFPYLLLAQEHDRYSFFGYESARRGMLDFFTSPPTIIKQNNRVNFYVCCGSYSDSVGQLRFYTNGIQIQDASKKMMLGGDSINAVSSFWQQYKNFGYPLVSPTFFLPLSHKSEQYVLLHQAAKIQGQPSGESTVEFVTMYSTIDGKGNGGLGRVVQKNQLLLNDSSTMLAAVKHGNGRDWWMLVGLRSTPIHYIYLINENGVNPPILQKIGPAFPDHEQPSISKFSHDGSIYVRHDERNGLRIYDFDRCSGKLSNLRILNIAFPTLDCNFSLDDRFMYINSWYYMMQVDLHAPDLAASLDTMAVYDGHAFQLPFESRFYSGQIRQDGKIYYSTTNSTLNLHVVHHPELPGTACNMQQHGLSLPYYNNGSMCTFPNYRLGRLKGSPCDTLPYAGPVEDRFTHTPYAAHRAAPQDTLPYRVLSPLRGAGRPPGPDLPDMVLWPILYPERFRASAAGERDEGERQ